MSTSVGSAILAVLESDALAVEGPPLLAFLTDFGAAGGDQFKIMAAVVKLQGAVVGSLPALETAISAQIAAALTAKLQAAIASVQAAVHPAT